jgi:hypothetical protein
VSPAPDESWGFESEIGSKGHLSSLLVALSRAARSHSVRLPATRTRSPWGRRFASHAIEAVFNFAMPAGQGDVLVEAGGELRRQLIEARLPDESR